MRKSRFGIPYFEVALVLVLFGVLVLVWVDRFWYYRELTEKTVFELTVRNMQSGLRLEKTRRILAGEPLQALEKTNPLHYLENAPENVHTEQDFFNQKTVRKSGWTFVRKDGTLYYVPLMNRHLRSKTPMLAMRINNDLEILTPYQWF